MRIKRAPHTHFPRGKRVFVILRNGEKFIDRYIKKSDDDKTVRFLERGDILVKSIRSIGYYKSEE